MTVFPWPLLVLLLAAILLVGSLANPLPPSANNPLPIACGSPGQPPDLIAETRKAASMSANLSIVGQLEEQFPLFLGGSAQGASPLESVRQMSTDELRRVDAQLAARILEIERIAQGPNRQCREVAEPSSFGNYLLNEIVSSELGVDLKSPLAQMYLSQSVVRTTIAFRESRSSSQEQFSQILTLELLRKTQGFIGTLLLAPSYEMTLSRTALTFYPLFLVLGNDDDREASLEVLSPERWEAIACGETSSFAAAEIEFDGSVFININDSSGYPVRQTAAEFWTFSSVLLNILSLLFDSGFPERYLETAVSGCTPELRLAASDLYLSLHPHLESEALETLTKTGGSPELQMAAAARLAPIWSQNLVLTDTDLQNRALRGETGALRQAAGFALGLRWVRRAETGQLDAATRFYYPPGGGVSVAEGTLAQFAAAHAGVHPELAQAAILPLFTLFRKDQAIAP